MFVIFSQVGVPSTIAATEPFAWAVALATNATGVEYPTGKFHRKDPTTLASIASRMALKILKVGQPAAFAATRTS